MAKEKMTQDQETQDQEVDPEIIIANPDDLVIRSLVPGLLTQLTCRMRGGRHTRREDIESREGANGEEIETWKAIKVIDDPEEHKQADKLRAKVRRTIKGLGVDTSVGLIIPVHRKKELAIQLTSCHKQVRKFNEQSKTMDILFRYNLHTIEGNNAGTIAAVTEQLNDILDRVNMAAQADDSAILEHATRAQLDPFKKASDVLKAPAEERIAIVAKVRAAFARKAISEASDFSSLLPEEAGLAVTDMVKNLRTSVKGWVSGSKKSEEEYEAALQGYDSQGISSMQSALVKAAAMADANAEAMTEAVAEGTQIEFNAIPEEIDGEGAIDDGGIIGGDFFSNDGTIES